MAAFDKFLLVMLLGLLSASFDNLVSANDPDMLQDICVADLTGTSSRLSLTTSLNDNAFHEAF